MPEPDLFSEDVKLIAEEDVQDLRPPSIESRAAKRKSGDIAATIGVPPNEARLAVSVGDTFIEDQAKSAGTQISVEDQFENDLVNGLSLEDIQLRFQDRLEKQASYQSVPEFLIEQALTVEDPRYRKEVSNYLSNTRILQEEFTKAIEEANGSVFSDVLDFIDYGVISFIPRFFEDVSRASERFGLDVAQAKATMAPAEFKEYVKDLVTEAREKGFLTGDSLFGLSVAYENALNAGYDPTADFAQAMAFAGALEGAALLAGVGARALRSTTAISSAANIKGTQAANQAASQTFRLFKTGENTDDGSLAALAGSSAEDLNKYPMRPARGPIIDSIQKNDIALKLQTMSDRGLFGRVLTTDEVEAAATNISDGVAKRSNGFVLDYDISRDGPNQFIVTTRIGRNETSTPFEELEDAGKVANKIPGARVEDSPLGDGYVVVVEQRVDPLTAAQGFVTEADLPYNALQDIYNRVLGSAGTRESPFASTQAFLAEQGLGQVRKEIWEPAMQQFAKLSGEERNRLDKIFIEFRDGDQAHRRRAPTIAEVEGRYYTMFGNKPSQKELDAWNTAVQINDTAWWINAQRKLDNAVRFNHTMIDISGGDDWLRAYPVARGKVPDNGQAIWDATAGRAIARKDLPEGQVVYQGVDLKNGYAFFTNPRKSRILDPEDVHPYNFGGSRTNPDARFFVGAVGRKVDNAGNVYTGRFKSAFSAFSEKEAKLGAAQLNSISRVLRDKTQKLAAGDWKLLKNLRKSDVDEINAIIRKNNDWNPHVTTLDDLIAMSNRTGVNFAEEGFKERARNVPVTAQEFGFDNSATLFDDILEFKGSGPRMDDVLPAFGGGYTYTPDPLEAISKQFTGSVLGFANKSYTNRSIAGWVRTAEQTGVVQFPMGVSKDEIFKRFVGSSFTDGATKTAIGRRLAEQKDIINRRLNLVERTGMTRQIGDMLTESLYGLSGGRIKADINSGSATGQLLKIGFYTKMGFYNIGQMVVQAMQVPVIMAISPVQGPKAAALTLAMRPLAVLGEEASQLAFQRISKFFGYSIDEVKEMSEFLRTSGRLVVDVEAAELQTGLEFTSSRGIRSMGGRALNASAAPFREGERLGRLTGEITAMLEFKEKFPTKSITSDFGRAWIAKRDQDLSFRMTATSRSLGQDGFMRVPTQWLTYTFRSLETLFTGSQFTRAERIRAFIPLVAMYGAAGIGAQQYGGWIAERVGVSPEEDFKFRAIKYGIIDAMVGEIGPGGQATAFSLRTAPGAQLIETFRKLSDGSVLEAIYGPSGGITADTFAPFYNGLTAAINGDFNIAEVDFEKALRSISSINNTVIAHGIITKGVYKTRAGDTIEGEFTIKEGILQALGFTPERVADFYQNKGILFMTSKEFQTTAKQMERYWATAREKMTDTDPAIREEGRQMAHTLGAMVELSNMTEQQKMEMRNRLAKHVTDNMYDTYKRLVDAGFQAEANRMIYLNQKGQQ